MTTYKFGQSVLLRDLMDQLSETTELDIFKSKVVVDFFEYQWNSYAKHIHIYGAVVHFIYMLVFSIYVNEIYLHTHYEYRIELCWAMFICLAYPCFYDTL